MILRPYHPVLEIKPASEWKQEDLRQYLAWNLNISKKKIKVENGVGSFTIRYTDSSKIYAPCFPMNQYTPEQLVRMLRVYYDLEE